MTKKIKKQKKRKKIVKSVKKVRRKGVLVRKIRPKREPPKQVKKEKPKPEEEIQRTKIRVIGIGGGAGSIISEIVFRVKKADFVVANTDSRSLKIVKRAKRFQFGQNLTGGLGTGMNPEIGELAAQNDKEKIKRIFEDKDFCIIIACLGGGTGSGATPIFTKIAKNSGCLTYGIFTLPFEFEGEKKMEIAQESLKKIKPLLNAFSVIPNERIFQIINKNTPLKEALSAINKRLAENLEGLIEMIYLPGLINIDFADLKTILAGRGRLTYLNTTEIEKPEKEEATKKLISSPLYPYTIKGARAILYNIVGGKDLQLSGVSQISKLISDSVNKNAKIIFGISQSSKYGLPVGASAKEGGKIRITLLVTGCGIKGILLKPLGKPKTNKPKPLPADFVGRRRLRRPKAEAQKAKAGKPKPILKPIPKPIPKRRPKPKPKPRPRPRPRPKPKPKPLPVIQHGPDKVRRNALQIKKVAEQEEKEILEKEKIWETPAILRREQ